MLTTPFPLHGKTAVASAVAGPNECKAACLRAWRLIREQGITPTQFIEFLQPLADLDGLVVSHFVETAIGGPGAAPTVTAGQQVIEQTERRLSFALDVHGAISVESNLMELH